MLPLRIPIAGKTTADRRIFVDADAQSSIRRLVIVQYETVNPGAKFSFVYPARPPASSPTASVAASQAMGSNHPTLMASTERVMVR